LRDSAGKRQAGTIASCFKSSPRNVHTIPLCGKDVAAGYMVTISYSLEMKKVAHTKAALKMSGIILPATRLSLERCFV